MANIRVWLFIESENLSVTQMSQRIGVSCDQSWIKGEPRGRTAKVFSTNSWKMEAYSEVEENPIKVGDMVVACLHEVLGRINGHVEHFRSLASDQKSGLYIGVSANSAPALEFKAETIKAISALGVDLELDLVL
jgi:uncharacterized protein DUF4279